MGGDLPEASPTALITGATGGIGGAVAEEAASRGYRTILLGRDRARLDGLALKLAELGGPPASSVVVDLFDDSSSGMAEAVDALDGRLDLLVNAAGDSLRAAPLEELTVADWQRSLQLHLLAPVELQRRCFPALVAAGGVIVNLGSIVAGAAPRRGAPYATAKAALAAASRSTAVEWAEHGIRSVVIEPGFVDTAFNAELVASGAHERLLARIPTGQAVGPAEVARLVFALADPDLPALTGGTVTLDGGLTARL